MLFHLWWKKMKRGWIEICIWMDCCSFIFFFLIGGHVVSVLLWALGESSHKVCRSHAIALVLSRSWPGSDHACTNTRAFGLYSFLLPVLWLWPYFLPLCSRSELMWVPHTSGPLDYTGWTSSLRRGLHFSSTLVSLDPQRDVSMT